MSEVKLEDIVSLCKRRGFIYQGSEIYGGLSGTYDYGPLGTQLKRNLTDLWWQKFVIERSDIYGLDTTILMNPKVWQASGHVDTFHDPLIEDTKTKKRYRLDHLLEANGIKDADSLSLKEMAQIVKDKNIKSPDGNQLGSPAYFNMMFRTTVGPIDDADSVTYLRPETAQGMFTNFKNVLDSFHPKLPFGIAQIGRSFRNEISPGNFIFRLRELEIMELEYFIDPKSWQKHFDEWSKLQLDWFSQIGLAKTKIKSHEVPAADRAHYSKRTIDYYFNFPSIGFQELTGLAYRTDFDLASHQKLSGKSLEYQQEGNGQFIPHVIEPTFGVDRHLMAILAASYKTDEISGEPRVYLDLPSKLAPVKLAVSPLLKNKAALVSQARQIFTDLKKDFGLVIWDDNGNIGKRYRRQDEIGTPYCITVDFETVEGDGTVTIRNRNTAKQDRLLPKEIKGYIEDF